MAYPEAPVPKSMAMTCVNMESSLSRATEELKFVLGEGAGSLTCADEEF